MLSKLLYQESSSEALWQSQIDDNLQLGLSSTKSPNSQFFQVTTFLNFQSMFTSNRSQLFIFE